MHKQVWSLNFLVLKHLDGQYKDWNLNCSQSECSCVETERFFLFLKNLQNVTYLVSRKKENKSNV